MRLCFPLATDLHVPLPRVAATLSKRAWAGHVKKARPHWIGAVSAVTGAKTDCVCVQASHWCTKDQEHGCQQSCLSRGVPTPENYCVPISQSADICHGTSKNGSQASNSLGLALGGPPDKATAECIAKNLRDDVVSFGNKTTTGVCWHRFPVSDVGQVRLRRYWVSHSPQRRLSQPGEKLVAAHCLC